MAGRLVLWDIDRTLIFAGGVDKDVWVEVCSELVGRPVTDLVGTSGRTDPQILLDALLRAGVEETEARRLLPKALRMEVGRLAAYLCSEDAGFITGTDVLIDGGWCAQ